jgi:AAA15 family ATPase/GTPase
MIHYIKIENFGPIKSPVILDFEVVEGIDSDDYEMEMPDGKKLLKLAYIYGPNASGKTTILKAMDFLRKLFLKPLNEKSAELNYDPFLFQKNANKTNSSIELGFYFDKIRYVYNVWFDKESIHQEKIFYYETAKPTELFSRITDVEKRLAKIHFGSKVKVPARERDLLESNTLHNNSVFGAFAKTNVDIPELEGLNKWFSKFLMGMISSANDLTEITATLIDDNPRLGHWMDEFLNKADTQIKNIKISNTNSQISLSFENVDYDFEFTEGLIHGRKSAKPKHRTPTYYGGGPAKAIDQRRIDFVHRIGKENYLLPISKESSGTTRYFGLGGPLYELIHGSKFLCIDELETSLHPDLMKYVLQTFLVNSKESQLLITTHNLFLMEESDFIRRDALWFTEKDDEGRLNLFSAADFDTTTLRRDASLINAYKSGRLGAKPNLGSPYISKD